MTASKQLSARVPDAQTWFIRIGHPAVDHFELTSNCPFTAQLKLMSERLFTKKLLLFS
jgi:hypothetical protein